MNGEGGDEVLSCGMGEGEGGGEGFEGAVVEDVFADLGVIASWYRLGSRRTRGRNMLEEVENTCNDQSCTLSILRFQARERSDCETNIFLSLESVDT